MDMSIKSITNELLNTKKHDALFLIKNEKINKSINFNFQLPDDDYTYIIDAIEIYELAIINMWKDAFDTENSKNIKKEFTELCKTCFDLLNVLKIPNETTEKINHVFKLITYSYLGEKWEDVKRILQDDDGEIWKLKFSDENWKLRLLVNTYRAILYLCRKRDWDDVTQLSELIKKLRDDQKQYEETYLNNMSDEMKISSAYELASLYHLAKCVEIMGEYMSKGTPKNILANLGFHFDKSIMYCKKSNQIELELILRMLKLTFRKMIENSIWSVAYRINPDFERFVNSIIKSSEPIFELMYPQRITILDEGLLDPANKAIVISLPTSSGKTLLAEFRILQAINQHSDDNTWIAYVVPTRALVNQITNRLRKDLGPLKIKIEKMSGILEFDAFEQSLLDINNSFNILVLTPEKLNLLIRKNLDTSFNDSLSLAIIDESHNLSDGNRGLNLEILLSIIKNDCTNANLLLLSPFLPNNYELAQWLDPLKPKSINIKFDWQPNDMSVGLFYPTGKRRNISTNFKPMLNSPPPRKFLTDSNSSNDDQKLNISNTNEQSNIVIATNDNCKYTASELKSQYLMASLVSKNIVNRGNVLIISGTIDNSWKIAETLIELLPKKNDLDDELALIKKYISTELGDNFLLLKCLDHGIGVHNAGLPDDIKYLMEWLMENNRLNVLVSTTTIAQGMNFPVSTIILSSYSYPGAGPMASSTFWNIAGRAGRSYHNKMGIIGIVTDGKDTPDAIKAAEFLKKSVDDVFSVLHQLLSNVITKTHDFKLESITHDPDWSAFRQYIAHMFRQSETLDQFIAQTDLTLRNTYGYYQSNSEEKRMLLDVVNQYAQQLNEKQHLIELSDHTGFSLETIEDTAQKIKSMGISSSDWKSDQLFSTSSNTLMKLMTIMLNDVPETKELAGIKLAGSKNIPVSLSNIISDWVSGKTISEIAKTYFGGTDVDSIKNCVNNIYGKLSNYTTWGLSAIQKISSYDPTINLISDDEKIKNLPAMVYYGVNTDEAILMRMNNIPRIIANNLGRLYNEDHIDTKIYDVKSQDVINWLTNLEDEKWDSSVPLRHNMNGMEYKKIWKIISNTI